MAVPERPWSSKKELLFSQGDRDGVLWSIFHFSPKMEDSRQGGLREPSIPQNTSPTNGLKAQLKVGVLPAQ